MNKDMLIDTMAGKSGLPKKDAERAVNAFIETVSDALANGQKITIIGLGTFTVVTRKARPGRNPQTGKTIQIDEKKAPKFTPGTSLKNKVAGIE